MDDLLKKALGVFVEHSVRELVKGFSGKADDGDRAKSFQRNDYLDVLKGMDSKLGAIEGGVSTLVTRPLSAGFGKLHDAAHLPEAFRIESLKGALECFNNALSSIPGGTVQGSLEVQSYALFGKAIVYAELGSDTDAIAPILAEAFVASPLVARLFLTQEVLDQLLPGDKVDRAEIKVNVDASRINGERFRGKVEFYASMSSIDGPEFSYGEWIRGGEVIDVPPGEYVFGVMATIRSRGEALDLSDTQIIYVAEFTRQYMVALVRDMDSHFEMDLVVGIVEQVDL